MPPQITALGGRVQTTLRKFSLAQKTLAVIGVAVLVLGTIALSSWLTKPTMSPLFSNVSATDASAMVDQLTAQGVPYQLADGGATILVPADQVYAMRLKMAAAGLPATSDGGYSLLDKMSATSSDFTQQITYQRAMEGELAKTISAINGVTASTVKLAIPKDTVFVATKSDPTASVFVKTAPGVTLGTDQVQSIVHLVSASIEGMKPTDVSVVDADGKVLSAVGSTVASGIAGQQTSDYEARVQASIQAILDRVVGAGKGAVTVNADLNYDQTHRTSESYTAPTPSPLPPLSSATTSEVYAGNGTATGGVLGPNNIAVPSGTSTAGTGSYSKNSATVDNTLDKVTEDTITAPGTVRRMSVAVVLDSKAAASLDMTQMNAMIAAAAGIDPTRGDTVSVSKMAFDTTSAAAAQTALAQADAATQAAQKTALIKQGAIAGAVLLLVIFLVIVGLRQRGKARREALDLGELRMVHDDDDPLGLGMGPGHDAFPAIPAAPPVPEGPSDIAIKRAEIGAFAEEQPAEVAELLRGWLVGGKR
jgi:flagellar M-ring protein FliF